MAIRAPIGRDASFDEIREASDALLFHTAGDLLPDGVDDFDASENKGNLGELLEEYYGMENDNDPGPDFRKEGIELKGKPLHFPYDEYVYPQEPISVGMLDYGEVAETSHWKDVEKLRQKLQDVIIVWHDDGPERKADFRYVWWQYIEFPDEYVDLVQAEYEEIRRQILDGEHLSLSAADNDYLQACPKHNFDFENREPGSYVVDSGHPHLEKPERQSWRIPCRFLNKLLADSVDAGTIRHGEKEYIRKGDLIQEAERRSISPDSSDISRSVSLPYQSNLGKFS